MPATRRACFAVTLILGAALAQAPAHAQSPAPVRVRGEIELIDQSQMRVRTKAGDVTLKLTPDTGVTLIAPIAIEAIKPGSFIGTAAVQQPDGTLKALEVQVFPEAMRGVGEGHRPWDLGPGSTMTNGTVGDLAVSNGRLLTLTYKGGEQKVFVPENAPVITYLPGTRADLQQGAHVIVTATPGAPTAPSPVATEGVSLTQQPAPTPGSAQGGGSAPGQDVTLTATRIGVGKDGLVPPM